MKKKTAARTLVVAICQSGGSNEGGSGMEGCSGPLEQAE